MGLVVGVDLGGTQIRAILRDTSGQILAREAMLTHASEGVNAVIGRIAQVVRSVGKARSWSDVRGIGIGVPGPVDPKKGLILQAPNLPGWFDVPLAATLADMFHVPVSMGNDANLAALGEHAYGIGRGVDNLIYMTISTGIGGGILADGRLLHGAHGAAGEIGHQTIEPNGPLCGCGNHGCLEALASGTAIARQARQAAAEGHSPQMLALAGGSLERIDGKIVGEAALGGDRAALRIIHQAATYIGIGLSNLANILNPELFVLGGGVTNIGDLLFDTIRATIAQRAMPAARHVRVARAALGDDVVLFGATALIDPAEERA